MNAYILSIGDELLIGQVVDTNAAWLGQKLTELGVTVDKVISLHDDEKAIVENLEEACAHADIVILTGGLGPTKDDITKASIANFLDSKMIFNPDVYQNIVDYLAKFGKKPTAVIRHHSMFPEETIFLQNKMGTAPGMVFSRKNSLIISVPGVPYEMKYIMENEGFPLIKAKNSDIHIVKKTILTAGEFEAVLADKIADIVEALPAHFSFAFLPNLNQVRLRLIARGTNKQLLEREVSGQCDKITDKLGNLVFGFDEESLSEVVGKLLLKNKLMLSTAESCTGGYLAHLITVVSGASAYYKGSVIAYSNELKMALLDVKAETLQQFGAVSEQTVSEMVSGVLLRTKTDIALAVSGIAGPGGGTEEKPVGTIWIACGNRDTIVTGKLILSKDRTKNIEASAIHALDMIRHFIIDEY